MDWLVFVAVEHSTIQQALLLDKPLAVGEAEFVVEFAVAAVSSGQVFVACEV